MKNENGTSLRDEATAVWKTADERVDNFPAEIRNADDATAGQLIASWKETILEELAKFLSATKDLKALAALDTTIAAYRHNQILDQGGKKNRHDQRTET